MVAHNGYGFRSKVVAVKTRAFSCGLNGDSVQLEGFMVYHI